jgi:patatin-like phospholipase/acyl hydrolase
MAAPFRILALSGGGYQGLFTAQVLAAIEAAGPGLLRDRFDLIAGTSIGGIIALALAAGVPASRIVDTFLETGPTVFPNGPVRGGRLSAARDALHFLNRPKYDPAPLRDLMCALPRPDLRLADLPVDVLIPATRVRDGEPVLFTRVSHPDLPLVEVALATSAAPMMFPTHRIGGDAYADGAIFATAPDLLAIRAAQRAHGAHLDQIHLLSVGTLNARFRLPPPGTTRLGILGWVQGQRLVRTVLAAQERLATRGAAELIGERYRRIDAEVGEGEGGRIGLDVATPEARDLIGRISARTISALESCCPPHWG